MVDLPPMPDRIARLPRDHRGYPVPWFVAIVEGEPDFRVMDGGKWHLAIRHKLCWVCGEPLGRNAAAVIGPMCAVNRITSEPPCHLECARWSAIACPFLTRPRMRRNEKDLPIDKQEPGGFALLRNPGCAVVWVTRKWTTFKPSAGGGHDLIQLGDPESVLWFVEGHAATRDEVLAAFERGLPALREMCEKEPIEKDRQRARNELERMYQQALYYIPKEQTA